MHKIDDNIFETKQNTCFFCYTIHSIKLIYSIFVLCQTGITEFAKTTKIKKKINNKTLYFQHYYDTKIVSVPTTYLSKSLFSTFST